MSDKLSLIARNINVNPLLWELLSHPEVWDTNTERTSPPDSPHHGLSDVWVRYAEGGCRVDGPHESVWYDSPILQAVQDLVFPLMAAVKGTRLGGVLITRIPPGQMCQPHVDPGWHAAYYDKFAIQIASAPGQAFHFDDESLESHPGDVYWFDNSYNHWVTNPTQYDRITLIVCIRKEK